MIQKDYNLFPVEEKYLIAKVSKYELLKLGNSDILIPNYFLKAHWQYG